MAKEFLSRAKLAKMRKAEPDAELAKLGIFRNRMGEFSQFKSRESGKLDRQYLRICATHALLDRGLIGKERAIELLSARKVKNALAVVEQWLMWPRKRFHGETPRPVGGLGRFRRLNEFRLAA